MNVPFNSGNENVARDGFHQIFCCAHLHGSFTFLKNRYNDNRCSRSLRVTPYFREDFPSLASRNQQIESDRVRQKVKGELEGFSAFAAAAVSN